MSLYCEIKQKKIHVSKYEDVDEDFEEIRISIEVRDFILIKFTTQYILLHDIGCTIEINGDSFSVNFLKRSDGSIYTFIYSEKEVLI